MMMKQVLWQVSNWWHERLIKPWRTELQYSLGLCGGADL